MTQLRVIIIDDDRQRREMIQGLLPDYMESTAVGSGEGAIEYLKRDKEGRVPDLVIMNGDDRKSFGLYIYDWMINKSEDKLVEAIPVIVLTADEFSERSLEFLEIGDVLFYEGEIEESELFSVINDAIEEAEFMPTPVEPVYEETKNIDRLMGLSVKAPGEIGKQRAVVLDMDSRMQNLEAALERGRRRAQEIRTVINAAQTAKSDYDDLLFGRRQKQKRDTEKAGTDVKKSVSFFDKAKKKVEEPEELQEPFEEKEPVTRQESIDSEGEQKNFEIPGLDSVNRLREKAISNPYGAFNAQGSVKPEERPKSRNADNPTDKKRIVIVDDDVKTRKLCSLFLTQNYSVVTIDSGIKTVDYFVQNKADLLIINPGLKGMSGITTVASVRMQPGGANVPVMYLVGDDYPGARSKLIGNGVFAIPNKPIKRDFIIQTVEGFFQSSYYKNRR